MSRQLPSLAEVRVEEKGPGRKKRDSEVRVEGKGPGRKKRDSEVIVEGKGPGRKKRDSAVRVEGKGPGGKKSDFVYVNSAYVGSESVRNNISQNRSTRRDVPANEPVTTVYREQYCMCARWPYSQKALAISVGVLLGALVGLAILLSLIVKL